MQSRWRAQKCPFFLAAGSIVQLPLLLKFQRGARRPNSRGRLSLNKTPMARVTRALVPPLGFRIICRRPHHQLLNVKQNPPFHQNRPGVVPCRKSKKKKNLPPPPKPVGALPPPAENELCATGMQCDTDIGASNGLFGRTNHFSSGTALARVRVRENHFRRFLTPARPKVKKWSKWLRTSSRDAQPG